MRKVEIKRKELRKGRGIKDRNEIERKRKKNWRVLVKLGNKMCMPFCCDDCVYFNILMSCFKESGPRCPIFVKFFKLTVFVQNVLFNMYFIFYKNKNRLANITPSDYIPEQCLVLRISHCCLVSAHQHPVDSWL